MTQRTREEWRSLLEECARRESGTAAEWLRGRGINPRSAYSAAKRLGVDITSQAPRTRRPKRDPFASVTLAVMTSGALRLEHGPNAALTAEVLDAFKLARPGEHHHAVTRMHAQGEVVLASERVALELAFLLNAREPSPVWQVTPAAPRQP